MTIDESFATAKAHIQAGRLDQAEATYRQILADHPDHALAHYNLANLLRRIGRDSDAMAEYEQALIANPQFPEAMNNLALLLQTRGKFDRAVELFRAVIALKPESADAHTNLGLTLSKLGRHAQAIESCEKATTLRPDGPEVQSNLSIVLRDAGQLDRSLAAAQRVVALWPEFADGWQNLAAVLCDLGLIDQGLAAYQRVMRLEPADAVVHSTRLLSLLYDPNQTPQSILAECRAWNDRFARPLSPSIRPHDNDPDPDRRLRIGYVSPDFCRHIVAWNCLPLFSGHDHKRVEVFCYSSVARPDEMTKRIAAHADHWRDIAGMDDDRAAEMIRADRIDILVDMTMHMSGNRLLLFARKPAPVQVTFMGYPGTTGVAAIDYRLTDPYLDPAGCHDADYSERTIRLPDTYWCYDPAAEPLPADVLPNALPALLAGHVTFGCLSSFGKISDPSLSLWAVALHAVPASRILILAPQGSGHQRVLDRLKSAGIDPTRIDFIPRQTRPNYLKAYHRIDVALDTVPYGGHSTGLDAYWMGVPTVSRIDATVVSRAGFSQASNLGLTELVADNDEKFAQIAASFSSDLPRLAQLRSTLRQRIERSPLMDGNRFARNVESAYSVMWRSWCENHRTQA